MIKNKKIVISLICLICLICFLSFDMYFIGNKNLIIGKIFNYIHCSITIKNKYNQEKLINVLNSFDLFNYTLHYDSFLFRLKNNLKSYHINNNNNNKNKILLFIDVIENKNNHTFHIKGHHSLFDLKIGFVDPLKFPCYK